MAFVKLSKEEVQEIDVLMQQLEKIQKVEQQIKKRLRELIYKIER